MEGPEFGFDILESVPNPLDRVVNPPGIDPALEGVDPNTRGLGKTGEEETGA